MRHFTSLGLCFVALCLLEALVHFFPVDGVPPVGQILGALVLVLQIVRMLPDVVAKNGVAAL